MATSYRRFVSMFCAMSTILVVAFPSERYLDKKTEVHTKCIGVLTNKELTKYNKCQGTFLTQKHLATSCRCIGTSSDTTGIFTKGTPSSYTVSSWSNGPKETQEVANLYFHPDCGIEPNSVILDMGLVETVGPFSEDAVTPATLPDALPFRFHEYMRLLIETETWCKSSHLSHSPGRLTDVWLTNNPFKKYEVCQDLNRKNCTLIVMTTNNLFAMPRRDNPDAKPKDDPIYKDCDVSGGAPLICHKNMLVGINGRSARCSDPYDSHMFIRMDSALKWLMSQICEENQ